MIQKQQFLVSKLHLKAIHGIRIDIMHIVNLFNGYYLIMQQIQSPMKNKWLGR